MNELVFRTVNKIKVHAVQFFKHVERKENVKQNQENIKIYEGEISVLNLQNVEYIKMKVKGQISEEQFEYVNTDYKMELDKKK